MSRGKLTCVYILLTGLPLLGVLAVLNAGHGLTPEVFKLIAAPETRTSGEHLILSRLILQILVILAVSRAASWLFQRIRQPQVIGEMAAGIALGPSLLGWLAPGISAALFPPSSLNYLNAFSQIGLMLFLFLVGLSLNFSELHEHGHSAVVLSHASIAIPFSLGTFAALAWYPKLSNPGVGFTSFALFIGAAMSITAFPVLARILAERNLLRTRMGSLVITCAAADDVTGWCVLAAIVVLVHASATTMPLWLSVAGILTLVFTMIYGVKPLLSRFEKAFYARGSLTDGAVAGVVFLILGSALVTESLGIHVLFGAFLLGAVMPKDPGFVTQVRQRFEPLALALLLPLFFAYTGLRTHLSASSGMWLYTGMALIVAVGGKFGGCLIAGRMSGMPWRDAGAVGALMNTRGLMELVILNIGLDLGVISPAVFSMMVAVALITTLMAAPLLDLIYRGPHLEAALSAQEVA
jgi:Kef-type K+ transport system membrane component KefB